MKKIKPLVVICQIFILVLSIMPSFNIDNPNLSYYSNQSNILNSNEDKNSYTKNNYMEQNNSLISIKESWNSVSDSIIDRNFVITDTINQSTPQINIDNSNEWSLSNEFNFSDIKTEKIINGDAETNELLWTHYIPQDYEGNVTRESSPPNGNVIHGDYSWYFNIETNQYTTIVGFDDAINLSSDSVIFGFSYSLIRNNLGTSYDSNICIRLFFQFDIYIFIWFNGYPGTLSNVTGPGGYADLLINEAIFDGAIHNYSLNVTALGLELFNQKPDQLRSFAVQTWGGEQPYQMEFILDDISLTDQTTPTEIDLKINSMPVIGAEGKGFLTFNDLPSNNVEYNITSSSTEKVMWNCQFTIIGSGKIISKRRCEFENWEQIRWIEEVNYTCNKPSFVNEILLSKFVPMNWVVNIPIIDNVPKNYQIETYNSTHQKIILLATPLHSIEFSYLAENKINNLILSGYQITHDTLLTITAETSIINSEIHLYILDFNSNIIFSIKNFTSGTGNVIFTNIKFSSTLPRDTYSVYVFWNFSDNSSIGKKTFDIITSPSILRTTSYKITTNYKHNFFLEVDYVNLEQNSSIDLAKVEYEWDFGTGNLNQITNKKYVCEVMNIATTLGSFYISLSGSKVGYASSAIELEIEIIFTDFNLLIHAPNVVIPSDIILTTTQVIDNNSNPMDNMKVRFKVNDQLHLDTWSNKTGHASMLYYLSPLYKFNTLNLSCSIVINDNELLTILKIIFVNLLDGPHFVTVGEPIQNIEYNNSVLFAFYFTYPSVGKNWYTNIPTGFTPIAAKILAESVNISVNVSPIGILTWSKDMSNLTSNNDILLLEINKPIPSYQIQTAKNFISIEISIQTNSIPFNGLKVKIERDNSWLIYKEWNLYQNDVLISKTSELEITNELISFKIYTNSGITFLTYRLEGTKAALIEISPLTIICGIGILILTIISIILLVKKKSPISLEIQI